MAQIHKRFQAIFSVTIIAVLAAMAVPAEYARAGTPFDWKPEWPQTDFSRHSVKWSEIFEGGPPKDGIPSIDYPRFAGPGEFYPLKLGENEPVISFSYNNDARAYPLRIVTRHEIVNDVVGGLPVAVTYCPLCNLTIVFDRTMDGRVLDFGTTGKLRNSDLVMYDRESESWWQQFTGEAIVGLFTGKGLKVLPSRLESLANFRKRYPDGRILLPAARDRDVYRNPYERYDSRYRPFPFYSGHMPDGIEPMARVVAVGDRAWALSLLAAKGRIEEGDLVLSWSQGQNSALDTRDISKGRDVGNVVVQRRTAEGLADVPYVVTFAFAFAAFHPDAAIRTQ